MATVFSVSHVSLVDQLGEIKAQIADLQAIERKLSDQIKEEYGAGRFEGEWFDATITEVASRSTLDAKAAEAKLRELGVDGRWFSKNQKTIAGYTQLKVTARKTSR